MSWRIQGYKRLVSTTLLRHHYPYILTQPGATIEQRNVHITNQTVKNGCDNEMPDCSMASTFDN